MKTHITIAAAIALISVASCGAEQTKEQATTSDSTITTVTDSIVRLEPPFLPAPFATESANVWCDVIGWPEGRTPQAPAGFAVTKFADGLQNPRWIYRGPNGDIFVCESSGKNNIIKAAKAIVSGKAKAGNVEMKKNASANRITLFRDNDKNGSYETRTVFVSNLFHPLGMLILGDKFYVANNNSVVSYPYQVGQSQMTAQGTKIADLPEGEGHWTRNIIASADGSKIYIAVGSGSNVAEDGMEKEEGKAMIWEMNPDGSGMRKYATGIRNPVGMAIAPGTTTLWTAVNERDGLGDDLVPDYLTSVQDGGFYGWPYSYWGQNEDPRMKDKQNPALVKSAIMPDVSMGAHTASLGLAFDEQGALPGRYKGGAFVGQHGSWNRSRLAGYAVVFVPFSSGRPINNMEPFLTGFVADSTENKVYGRPVGVAFTQGGDLLVADDASNTIWKVSAVK